MITKILKKFTNQQNLFNFATHKFDLTIIGGGPGGYVAAIKAAQLGLKTACVEKRGSLGGTCLNVGCIPSKALLNISHKYEEANKHFKELGIEINKIDINWNTTLKKKQNIVTGLTRGIQHLFKKNKVQYFKGTGKFLNKNQIQVATLDGKVETIQSKNTMIATGSEPNPFPGLPFDEKIIISSTGALQIQKIPKEIVIVGGGVIGLQLGSVYQRLGTKITVVQFLDQICPTLDGEVASQFNRLLTKQGMQILTSHKVVSGKNLGDRGEITIQPVKGGAQKTLSADHILISTGRRPYTNGLGAKQIGINIDNRGRIQINKHFQTNIPNIFAIGDVVQGAMLAHKAEQEGIACVQYITGRGGHVNYDAIPSVIYTHPQVAAVGKTEQQLKKANIQYKKGSFPFLANSRAKANNDTEGFVKVLSDKKTDKILGVHIISPGAGQMIAEAVIGIQYGAASEDLARTCHAHPTLSQAFKEACMATYDKPIHF